MKRRPIPATTRKLGRAGTSTGTTNDNLQADAEGGIALLIINLSL